MWNEINCILIIRGISDWSQKNFAFADNTLNDMVHIMIIRRKKSVAAGPPWGSARELSLSPLPWQGTPPTLLAPGRVTSPRQLIGV